MDNTGYKCEKSRCTAVGTKNVPMLSPLLSFCTPGYLEVHCQLAFFICLFKVFFNHVLCSVLSWMVTDLSAGMYISIISYYIWSILLINLMILLNFNVLVHLFNYLTNTYQISILASSFGPIKEKLFEDWF